MKRFTKILTLLMVVCLSIGMFASCDKNDALGDKNDAPGTSDNEKAEVLSEDIYKSFPKSGKIIAVVEQKQSIKVKIWKTTDFEEVSCIAVANLSDGMREKVKTAMFIKAGKEPQENYTEEELAEFTRLLQTYYQVLIITVEAENEAVLEEARAAIEARDDIAYAFSDGMIEFGG